MNIKTLDKIKYVALGLLVAICISAVYAMSPGIPSDSESLSNL